MGLHGRGEEESSMGLHGGAEDTRVAPAMLLSWGELGQAIDEAATVQHRGKGLTQGNKIGQ